MTIFRPDPKRNYIKAFDTAKVTEEGKIWARSYETDQIFTLHLGTKDGIEVDVLSFCLEGDCCSHSYFDPPVYLNHLVGQQLVQFEEVGSDKEYVRTDDECTIWHCLKITTNKESFTLDWRNDSNGYYDGNLNVVLNDTYISNWDSSYPEGWEVIRK